MSGNELSVYDRFSSPDAYLESLGKAIMHSEMFGCTNASQGKILALECAARKAPPMSLAERYHIIKGKLSMKADAMLADFRTKVGGSHHVNARTPQAAEIQLSRGDETQLFRLTWEEAQQEPFVYLGAESTVVEKLANGKQGDLTIKPKYRTPRSRMQMLWARVVSDGVRAMAPEVVAGYYTPEEVSDFAEGPVNATVIDAAVVAGETTEAATEPEPEPAEPKAVGVRLGGLAEEDAYSASEHDGCGVELAEQIKMAAVKLSIPPAKLKEILARHGAGKISGLPICEAEELLAKLRAKLAEAGCPF
uniref:Uncharacterized protein n=1 Tax=viral metagenome TaxID=1070528 RepID=A0A6M3KX87_9ZZZZ